MFKVYSESGTFPDAQIQRFLFHKIMKEWREWKKMANEHTESAEWMNETRTVSFLLIQKTSHTLVS
jgi:hypothetical protein